MNHHMDVVAADPAQWTHPPFSGTIADGFGAATRWTPKTWA
ncbi:MAG: hypothetical protein ACUVR4_14865 [Anaerolineae bacterium]